MRCTKCGKITNNKKHFHLGMCQACYNYYRNGGTENPIPQHGKIEHDYRGFIICHICGRAYKKLGGHIKESHNMTIAEYKEQYGLCNNARTTEENYSKTMRNFAYKYGMDEQLKRVGKNTRIRQGENDKRKGKKSRLQECLDRSKRYKNKGE